MIKTYQVTLYNPSGKYKPVSCLVNREQYSDNDYSNIPSIKKELQREGVRKICQKRLWRLSDLAKYEYTRYKVRAYAGTQV